MAIIFETKIEYLKDKKIPSYVFDHRNLRLHDIAILHLVQIKKVLFAITITVTRQEKKCSSKLVYACLHLLLLI